VAQRDQFPHLREPLWGRHPWARGYFAVTTGTITDAISREYIAKQEGERVQDNSRFRIDDQLTLSSSSR
jgi:putative transposase